MASSVVEDSASLRVGLAVDVALAGGRAVPAAATDRQTRGSIGGRVRVSGTRSGEFPLEGLPILVDGSTRTRTGSGGRFLIQGLEPGVYAVELDPAGLAVELVVRTPVRAGARPLSMVRCAGSVRGTGVQASSYRVDRAANASMRGVREGRPVV